MQCRNARLTVLLIALVGSLLAGFLPTTALAAPSNVRILTYNVAFLHLEAEHPSPSPPPILCDACEPFEVPPGPPGCQCWPLLAIQPNLNLFADIDEVTRAQRIAERILATDQDVVVLNEVFNPAARAVFVNALAHNGPYDHYISRLRGHPPIEGLTLGDIIQFETGLNVPEILPLDFWAVPGDSGLMIFSKYPFLQLTGSSIANDAWCEESVCEASGFNGVSPLTPGFFAFEIYDDCAEPDCWASKGVGLVKIDAPSGPAYVTFTHMQADYPKQDWSATRAAQLGTIRDVILGAIPSRDIANAQVYVAGDLNVVGANRETPEKGNAQPWHAAFNPDANAANVASGFFACGNGVTTSGSPQPCRFGFNGPAMLTDSWGFQTSTTDLGITNHADSARLDYLLHSAGRHCMQHATIAWDLRADPQGQNELTWLSDHLPVRGDFGLQASHCSPNDDPDSAVVGSNVRELSFGATNCLDGTGIPCHQDEYVAPPHASIRHGGNFQWFIIRQAGSYSIRVYDVGEGPVDFDVYHHSDLSRPETPFESVDNDWGTPYSLPKPPYYIRTLAIDAQGAPDRSAASRDYALSVHQHLCRSPVDGCFLEPGLAIEAPYEYNWPATVYGSSLTELRELWWKFRTSGAKAGRLSADKDAPVPKVQMQLEGYGAHGYDCITNVDPLIEIYNDPSAPSQLVKTLPFIATHMDPEDHDWDYDGLRDDLRIAPSLPSKTDGEFETYFLKVTRDSSFIDQFNPCNASITTFTSYLTNLTYMAPQGVDMYAELDDDIGGEDNIQFYMGYDETFWHGHPPFLSSAFCVLDEPDSCYIGGNKNVRGYYLERVFPNLWEMDEEVHLFPWMPFGGTYTGIPTLTSWLSHGTDQQYFADGPNGNEADYYYLYTWRVCRTANDKHCSPDP